MFISRLCMFYFVFVDDSYETPKTTHVSDSEEEKDEHSSVSQVFPMLQGTEKAITFMKSDKSAKGHYSNKGMLVFSVKRLCQIWLDICH